MIGVNLFGATANLTTGYLAPVLLIKKLTLASGLFGLTMIPMTVALGLLPINEELHQLDKEGVSSDGAKAKRVNELVRTWEKKHMVRYISYVGSWALSMAALVLDGRV